MAEIWRRVALKERRRRRKRRLFGWIAGGAVFCAVIAMCFVLPGGVAEGQNYAAAGTGGQIDPQNASVGLYMLIAIVAFALGVAATLLLQKQRKRKPDNPPGDEPTEARR
jgi:H+/Cl- antiporter ClcA